MRSPNPCGVPVLDIGRDVNGRFRPANKGGPGNPFARKVASLRKTLLDSVSEQDLKAMIEALKAQALGGDKAAIKLILQYCVGKPEAPEYPDRMDIDEWERLQQMRVGHKEFQRTTEAVPACLACHLAALHWPCTIQDGDGPFPHAVHHIHQHMKAGAPTPTAPAQPTAATVAPNAPTEPAASTPASAAGKPKSD